MFVSGCSSRGDLFIIPVHDGAVTIRFGEEDEQEVEEERGVGGEEEQQEEEEWQESMDE